MKKYFSLFTIGLLLTASARPAFAVKRLENTICAALVLSNRARAVQNAMAEQTTGEAYAALRDFRWAQLKVRTNDTWTPPSVFQKTFVISSGTENAAKISADEVRSIEKIYETFDASKRFESRILGFTLNDESEIEKFLSSSQDLISDYERGHRDEFFDLIKRFNSINLVGVGGLVAAAAYPPAHVLAMSSILLLPTLAAATLKTMIPLLSRVGDPIKTLSDRLKENSEGTWTHIHVTSRINPKIARGQSPPELAYTLGRARFAREITHIHLDQRELEEPTAVIDLVLRTATTVEGRASPQLIYFERVDIPPLAKPDRQSDCLTRAKGQPIVAPLGA